MHPQGLALIFYYFLYILIYLFNIFLFLLMQKSQNFRFIGSQILFGTFMAKDSWHGVIFPAYQVVVANSLELTHSTSGARLP